MNTVDMFWTFAMLVFLVGVFPASVILGVVSDDDEVGALAWVWPVVLAVWLVLVVAGAPEWISKTGFKLGRKARRKFRK